MSDIKFTIRTDANSVIEGLHKAETAAEGTGKALSGVQAAAKNALQQMAVSNENFVETWKKAAKEVAAQRAELQRSAAAARELAREQQRVAAAQEKAAAAAAKAAAARGNVLTRDLGSFLPGGNTIAGGLLRGASMGAGLAAAGAVGLGKFAWDAAQQASALQTQQQRIMAASSQGGHVIDELNKFGMATGNGPTDLMQKAATLLQGGMGAETAINAIKSAIIATQNDIDRADSLLEKFVESTAKGFVEEGTLSMIEQQGVTIRDALGKALNMNSQQLQQAVAARQITVDQLASAFAAATDDGTAVREQFEANLDSMEGAMKRMEVEWGNACETIGTEFAEGLSTATKSIAKWASDNKHLFQGIGRWVSDVLETVGIGNGPEDHSDDPEYYAKQAEQAWKRRQKQREKEQAEAAQKAAESEVAAANERISAEEKLAQKLDANIKRYDQLDAAARKRAEDAELAGKTIADRRDAYSEAHNVDLSRGVDGVDAAIEEEFGERRRRQKQRQDWAQIRKELAAAGITSGNYWEVEDALAKQDPPEAADLLERFRATRPTGRATLDGISDYYAEKGADFTDAEKVRLDELYTARQYAETLDKQVATLDQIRRDETARAELIAAEVAGDKERLATLQRRQQLESLTADFRAKGFSESEAAKLAETRLSGEEAQAAKRENDQAAAAKKAAQNTAPDLRGYIEDALAKVGGGGARLRDIDLKPYQQSAQMQKDALAKTTAIAENAQKIWNYLANRQGGGVVLS